MEGTVPVPSLMSHRRCYYCSWTSIFTSLCFLFLLTKSSPQKFIKAELGISSTAKLSCAILFHSTTFFFFFCSTESMTQEEASIRFRYLVLLQILLCLLCFIFSLKTLHCANRWQSAFSNFHFSVVFSVLLFIEPLVIYLKIPDSLIYLIYTLIYLSQEGFVQYSD